MRRTSCIVVSSVNNVKGVNTSAISHRQQRRVFPFDQPIVGGEEITILSSVVSGGVGMDMAITDSACHNTKQARALTSLFSSLYLLFIPSIGNSPSPFLQNPVWAFNRLGDLVHVIDMKLERCTPAHQCQEEHLFAATRWTVVLAAKGESMEALNLLCSTYRPPLINWLRARGERLEDAEDRVQGFFEQLLRRGDLRQVAAEKGRFRTFLLTAFQNYLRDQFKRGNAAKRGGGKPVASLDESTEGGGLMYDPKAANPAPDVAYDRAWAQAILSSVQERLETEAAATGHRELCCALEPILFHEQDAPTYGEVADALGMTESAVKMAAHRIRQRLSRLIREQVGRTVSG